MKLMKYLKDIRDDSVMFAFFLKEATQAGVLVSVVTRQMIDAMSLPN